VDTMVYMRLKPQASAAAISPTCLGTCLDWLPSTPHDLLLVHSLTPVLASTHQLFFSSILIQEFPLEAPQNAPLEGLCKITISTTCLGTCLDWLPSALHELLLVYSSTPILASTHQILVPSILVQEFSSAGSSLQSLNCNSLPENLPRIGCPRLHMICCWYEAQPQLLPALT